MTIPAGYTRLPEGVRCRCFSTHFAEDGMYCCNGGHQVPSHDDLVDRVAQILAGEDNCCMGFTDDGRCCMSDEARRVLDEVVPEILTDIAKAGLKAGIYTGVLDHFAKREGIAWKHPSTAEKDHP